MNSWSKDFTVILIADYFTMLFACLQHLGIRYISVSVYLSVYLASQILKFTKLNSYLWAK